MELTSDAFPDGGAMPPRYTCDGDDVSPPLRWTGVPGSVAAFILVVRDPDAGGFVHWVLTDIPGDARELPDGAGDGIGMPGPNDFGRTGWAGPCPPSGEHRYVFELTALSEPLQADPGDGIDGIERAARERVVAQARLTGTYRPGR
jgi:Raf kinase inhibitor-like YbhB/YbcL family protein